MQNARRSGSSLVPSSARVAYGYGATAAGGAGADADAEAETDREETDREETDAPFSLPVLSGLVTLAEPVIDGELALQLPSLSRCASLLYLDPEPEPEPEPALDAYGCARQLFGGLCCSRGWDSLPRSCDTSLRRRSMTSAWLMWARSSAVAVYVQSASIPRMIHAWQGIERSHCRR